MQKKYGRIGFLQNKNRHAKDTYNDSWESMEHCKPQSPPKSVDSFCLKHGKRAIVRWKYGKYILAIVLFNLTVNLGSVKFTSVNLNLQLFYEINHKEIKNRKLNKNIRKYAELT